MERNILNIEFWEKVLPGLYQFKTTGNDWYELLITARHYNENILDGTASLYYAFDCKTKNHQGYIERECLASDKTVFECMEIADKDWSELCNTQ